MSETSQGPDWWLASDGKWYPPTSKPLSMTTGVMATQERTMSSGLSTATQIFFWLAAAASVASGILTFVEASRFQQWWDAPGGSDFDEFDAWRSAEDASSAALGISMLAGLVLAVLLLIWLYNARKTAERFGGTGTKWSPGWGIGGWFIPLANAVIPKLVFHEVERLSSADAGEPPIEGRWRQVQVRPDGWIFWLASVAGFIVVSVGASNTDEEVEATFASFDADSYRNGLYTIGVGLLLLSIGAVAGALMIRRLGAQLNRKLDTSPRRANDR